MWKPVVFVITVLLSSASSQNENNCRCVPYYLCEPQGAIITNGKGITAEKFGETNTCSSCNCADSMHLCCSLPISSRTPAYSASKVGACGFSNPDGIGFKIGPNGKEAVFGEFPWMVQILQDGNYRCGGSLIHPSVVLTAAHCIKSSQSAYTIRAGEWDTSNTDEILKHQDRKVSSIKSHGKFDGEVYHNDVALLFLDQPLELKAHISTTCLAPANAVVTDTRCIATGWGKARFELDDNSPSVLKKVDLPILKKSTCEKYLRNTRLGPYFNLHESFVCAGGEKDKDTCTGDGGGPLFCPIPGEEDRYQQVGIVSWGIDCNTENVPGVYANVGLLRNWIDKEMKKRNLDIQSYTY